MLLLQSDLHVLCLCNCVHDENNVVWAGACLFICDMYYFCIQISIFAEDCGGFLLRGHIDWAIGRKCMVYK